MNAFQAKKIIKTELIKRKIPFIKLSARTVDFTDLAREKRVFVRIDGWRIIPEKRLDKPATWKELKELARQNNFCIESDNICG